MQLYLVYFGANLLGLQADAWLAAALGLTLYTSAFLAEIWRGCIQAIPRGQWDGARALALSPLLQLRLVILPQALRIAIPPTVGFMVQVLKGTSLASIIGFVELTRAAQMVNNATFRPFIVYGLVAALYFMLCWPLSAYSRRLERRLGQRTGQRPGQRGAHPGEARRPIGEQDGIPQARPQRPEGLAALPRRHDVRRPGRRGRTRSA